MARLLITDLDNTLYDWVTYYGHSFEILLSELTKLLGTPRDLLIKEFKEVHTFYGNSEQPFATFDLPSVKARFPNLNGEQLLQAMAGPFRAFNSSRKRTLTLYDNVLETLRALADNGTRIVGHTEAPAINSFYRLKILQISDFFQRLYALEGRWAGHPIPGRDDELAPALDFLRIVPRDERKPNPALLLDICRKEAVSTADVVYVGDSITKDISMAKSAGIKAVWARYGTRYDRTHWDLLVKITHWSEDDVKREEKLREQFAEVEPDVIIDDFSAVLKLCSNDSVN